MQQNTSALLALLFAQKKFLPAQRTHAPNARSFHFAPTCYFLSFLASSCQRILLLLPCGRDLVLISDASGFA